MLQKALDLLYIRLFFVRQSAMQSMVYGELLRVATAGNAAYHG